MLNLLVAIRLWGKQWASRKVVLHCDNQAVVAVLTIGRTCDRTLAAIARNIKMPAAILNINLITIHILGKNNPIADLLSRWDITADPTKKLNQMLPNHTFNFVPQLYLHIDWSIQVYHHVLFHWHPKQPIGSIWASDQPPYLLTTRNSGCL